MLKRPLYTKILTVIFFVAAAQIALGSFSGSDDKSKNKFTLKNLSFLSKKYSLSALHTSGFHFIGFEDLYSTQNTSGTQINSMVTVQNGNTTYVYPYKYVIKPLKFKTPTAPHL